MWTILQNTLYYIILTGKSENNYAVVTPESGWGYCTDDLKCKLKGLLSYSGFSQNGRKLISDTVLVGQQHPFIHSCNICADKKRLHFLIVKAIKKCSLFFVGVCISNIYSLLTVSLLGTRRTGRKTADRAKNGKLQMVDQSLLPSEDCKKLCK